ncbi:L-fuconate dehydratase [uncultured Microbacterium sp.]|uniref:L-fuconate dehydratase n=1 Tax=uncultured Microbacterium sp. TaxID=191216 RepID=UPI002628803C|nr:L-fuconate dehydratase [uncultured Microbacterium sp.]
MSRIVALDTTDIRFPTSLSLDGSDAMNPDPDYSAAYVVIRTDADDDIAGHSFVFTIGRGNDVQVAAIDALAGHLVGREVEPLLDDMGGTFRDIIGDSQLRWLGPEKGVMHMAIGAVINALWDIKAKRAGLPLWQLLGRMKPEEIVDLVDFRYLTNALTREEALEILRAGVAGREQREAELLATGYPAYTTSPGWLGYSDEKLERLAREAMADGFTQIKLKVGADLDDDIRRFRKAREVVGPDFPIAIDANQRWEVAEAIEWVQALAEFDPAWIEEPTSPDDILGHAEIARGVAPIRVATGEHAQNRMIFKQLLQAKAIEVMQIDAVRVAGVNENIANLLLAAKFGVPVCPHAGGVGLCEAVQHLSMFDYVAVSTSREGRLIEFVDHLHEHFVVPTDIQGGSYMPPVAPGASMEMKAESIEKYAWTGEHVAD